MSGFTQRLQRSLRKRLQSPEAYRAWREEGKLAAWVQAGRPLPPPHAAKERAVREHARRYGTRILVETGTYKGDMVVAMRPEFDAVHSIELSQDLYEGAASRFAADDGVHIHQGDSGEVLGAVIAPLEEPCLFWLDGHYSGGITALGAESTPILRELEAIAAHPIPAHVILIDDARCFTGTDGYPTIDDLGALARRLWPDCEFRVADDILRILPPASAA